MKPGRNRLRFVVKLDGREEIAVVGDRHGGHLQFCCSLHQARDLAGAVEQTVITVEMQMNKIAGRHPEAFYQNFPVRRRSGFRLRTPRH